MRHERRHGNSGISWNIHNSCALQSTEITTSAPKTVQDGESRVHMCVPIFSFVMTPHLTNLCLQANNLLSAINCTSACTAAFYRVNLNV